MFGKKDLRSCDVVVLRYGWLGIVVESRNELVIVYQTGGFDTLDEFDDDLLNATHFEDEIQFDIMAVYRSRGVGNGFELYYETEQVFGISLGGRTYVCYLTKNISTRCGVKNIERSFDSAYPH